MKKIFYTTLFLAFGFISLQAQSLTITSPAGLTPPYAVTAGTEITFEWDYFSEAPTASFTHTETPVFPSFGTDPVWSQASNFINNGDGTFSFTVIITEPTWVWGGFFAPFISQWAFSDVFEINIASDIVISGDDLLLCDDGMDTEVLSVDGAFTNYQWYVNETPINDATSASYTVSAPGSYYVSADVDGETANSNTLHLSYIELAMTGALDGGGSEITLSASSGMDSYQWLSGPNADNLSPIPDATAETYDAAITTDLTYYALEASLAGCTIQTEARPIVESYFTPPVITVAADTNSFNVVCEGTPVTYTVADDFSSYQWYKNGIVANSSTHTITRNFSWHEGDYTVEVTPAAWPEIVITSAIATLDFQDIIQPVLVGVTNNGEYCPGEELNVILADEGYVYSWYAHTGFNDYSNDDILDVPGSTYSFVFDTTGYITVVAEFQGCTSNSYVTLKSYESAQMFVYTEDFNQNFLCPDSTNTIYVPSFSVDNFQDFQWLQQIDGVYEPIVGADTSFLVVSEPGTYSVTANIVACPIAMIQSNDRIIEDYTERNLQLWASEDELCVGEEATLTMNNGWQNIQWFEETIEIGNMGYEKSYIPMIGAGNESSQVVTEFQTYLVKAKHSSCPNGLKTTSNIVGIRPRVNPSITPSPNYGVYNYHVSAYDSIPNYVFCTDEPTTLSLDGEYDSYAWHTKFYEGDDDYVLGAMIPGADADTVNILAQGVDWYTAVVDSAGCVGYSDPVLIDTWAFLPPAVASYNNNEICPDEPALVNIAFPGDWAEIEWLHNGNPIPDSNNDSLWVTEPGTYIVNAYPALCPQFAYSSGLGPTLNIFEAEIVENDTLIYATPFDGLNYEYQWFLNGEPVSSEPDFPWIIYKTDLGDGAYTVKITNSGDCTAVSEAYVWTPTNDINVSGVKVYPNPTNNRVFIEGLDLSTVEQIEIFNVIGVKLRTFKPQHQKIEVDLSGEIPGLYMINVQFENGGNYVWKVNRI